MLDAADGLHSLSARGCWWCSMAELLNKQKRATRMFEEDCRLAVRWWWGLVMYVYIILHSNLSILFFLYIIIRSNLLRVFFFYFSFFARIRVAGRQIYFLIEIMKWHLFGKLSAIYTYTRRHNSTRLLFWSLHIFGVF